jgi:hypothetical protein
MTFGRALPALETIKTSHDRAGAGPSERTFVVIEGAQEVEESTAKTLPIAVSIPVGARQFQGLADTDAVACYPVVTFGRNLLVFKVEAPGVEPGSEDESEEASTMCSPLIRFRSLGRRRAAFLRS